MKKNRFRTHTCGELRKEHIGQEVTLSGWVENIRDHGGVLFLDLRDQYGTVQTVSNDDDMFKNIPRESVITVKGKVRCRDEETINKRLETFYAETLPVIQAFESEWKLITINADQAIEEIYNEMFNKLILS